MKKFRFIYRDGKLSEQHALILLKMLEPMLIALKDKNVYLELREL